MLHDPSLAPSFAPALCCFCSIVPFQCFPLDLSELAHSINCHTPHDCAKPMTQEYLLHNTTLILETITTHRTEISGHFSTCAFPIESCGCAGFVLSSPRLQFFFVPVPTVTLPRILCFGVMCPGTSHQRSTNTTNTINLALMWRRGLSFSSLFCGRKGRLEGLWGCAAEEVSARVKLDQNW